MGARTVEIQLDRPRRLKFDWNALADFEDAGGDFNKAAISGFKTLRLLLWAGLKWNDPVMTKAVAGDLIQQYVEQDGQTIATLGDIVKKALVDSGVIPAAELGDSGEPVTPEEAEA